MFRRSIDYSNVSQVRESYRPLPDMNSWQTYWKRDRVPYTEILSAAYLFMRNNPYGVIGNESYTLLFDDSLNQPNFEHHVSGLRLRLMLLANKSGINLADQNDFPSQDFEFISMIFYFHRILLLSVSLQYEQFLSKFPGSKIPDYPMTSSHIDGVGNDISKAIDKMIFMRELANRI